MSLILFKTPNLTNCTKNISFPLLIRSSTQWKAVRCPSPSSYKGNDKSMQTKERIDGIQEIEIPYFEALVKIINNRLCVNDYALDDFKRIFQRSYF